MSKKAKNAGRQAARSTLTSGVRVRNPYVRDFERRSWTDGFRTETAKLAKKFDRRGNDLQSWVNLGGILQ